jgi:hypothetical protein
MFAVQWLRRAEVHRDSVLDDLVLIENAVKHRQRPAAIHHVVFGDDLKPVDFTFAREDVIVMRDAQTDSNTVIREGIEAIGRHRELLRMKRCGWKPAGAKPPARNAALR